MRSAIFGVMLILLSIFTVSAQIARAGSYTFTDINHPGSTYTEAYGINNSGQVVGYYSDGNNDHGFIYSGGTFTRLDHPGATDTELYGISNDGKILGYSSPSYDYFVRSSSGNFVNIGATNSITAIGGINSSGKVVGTYVDQNGAHGFIAGASGLGGFSMIDYPGATATMAWGINDSDQVAGNYDSPPVNNKIKGHGFVVTGSNFTTIDYPGVYTCGVSGINNKGEVAGWYDDLTGGEHAFVYSGGSFTTLDYPGAAYTWADGINDNGDVVGGWCADAACNITHGFLASLGHSISGTVKKRDGTPVEDVTITLGGASSDTTQTDFQGNYSFSGLKSGSYTLTPSRGKSIFKPKMIHATVSGADLESQDFTLQTFSISGVIKTKKGEPADGVSIVLSGDSSDTTQTASDGTYSFQDLENGHYTVTPTPNLDWYYINPPFKNVSINGRDVKNVNFTGKTPHDISGRILQGINPVAGVTVTVTNSTTGWTAQATTDSDGSYEFKSLLDGSYVVTVSLAGFAFKPASRKVKLQDSDVADVDFSAILLHSISGTVTIGGAPLSGVTITLSGKSKGTTTTAGDGSYSFANLLGGTYTVTPKMSGHTFTPTKITVTITNVDVAGQDFAGK